MAPSFLNLCFWTSLPNDSLDRDHTNDQTCKTFAVIVPTNEAQTTSALWIAPNPAHDFCRLHWENEAQNAAFVKIFDATGMLIRETKVIGNEWEIPREGLTAGLYQVLVRTEEGQLFSGKMCWMD